MATHQTIWVHADLAGETVIVRMDGSTMVEAVAFAPPPGAALMLLDFVTRVVDYVDEHRAPDGTVSVSLEDGPPGVEQLSKRLSQLADCSLVLLSQEAPALAVLHEVVAGARGNASPLHPTPPPVEKPWAEPVYEAGTVGGEVAEDVPVGGGFQPLAPLHRGGQLLAPGLGESPGASGPHGGAHSVLREGSASTVIRMTPTSGGGGGASAGGGVTTVLREGDDPRGGAYAAGAPGPSGGTPAPAPARDYTKVGHTPAPVAPPAAPSPWATPEGEALEEAVRAVGSRHAEEVLASTGVSVAESPPGALLLWAMTHGRVKEVLGATPALAGEHLRASAEPHREAILGELQLTEWGDASTEEIALWLAERMGSGDLDEDTRGAFVQYRAAIRARR